MAVDVRRVSLGSAGRTCPKARFRNTYEMENWKLNIDNWTRSQLDHHAKSTLERFILHVYFSTDNRAGFAANGPNVGSSSENFSGR